MLEGKATPGPTEAALHLVQDQQRAGLVQDVAQSFEVARRGHDDAAVALDGLRDQGGHIAFLLH